ncbi:Retrovirus-related Pol polyprotein from transposon TNT 1-94 [Ceratocystis lukuohia]|uniref:Retrovirus-related Pol polyprotein from transposon TNT 1-94 n=1 Tax=Ceratocystis lukuohia TaxID=2019550 RepID=A0ABR4MMF2_9PEZI
MKILYPTRDNAYIVPDQWEWEREIARLAGRPEPEAPSIAHFRVIGSRAVVTLSDQDVAKMKIPKITPKGVEGILLGYEGTHMYVPMRWVFKVKLDGKYKARLVARGDRQKEGIDYNKEFASTAHTDSWRILMSCAVATGRVVRQADITAAYLHGIIREDVYVRPPTELQTYFEQFPEAGKKVVFAPGLVIKLRRTLYGLRQSGHEWQQVLKSNLKDMGFHQIPCDPATYRDDVRDMTVCSHVDDLLYDGPDERTVKEFKRDLCKRFHTNLSEVPKWHLGVNLAFNPNSISLDQITLFEDILEEAGMQNCKPSQTPAELPAPCPWQEKEDDTEDHELEKQLADRYRRLVGRMMYASTMTRPDIAYALGRLVAAFKAPKQSDNKALTKLLQYLSTNKSFKIVYTAPTKQPRHKPIRCYMYTDATWVDGPDGRSTSGIIIFIAGGPVMWMCKRQKVVARSSLESELISMSEGIAAATYAKNFASAIGHTLEIEVYADNKGGISTANKPDATSKATRHITASDMYIRDKVADGTAKLGYVSTKQQIADALTKPLSGPLVEKYNKVMFGGLDPHTHLVTGPWQPEKDTHLMVRGVGVAWRQQRT